MSTLVSNEVKMPYAKIIKIYYLEAKSELLKTFRVPAFTLPSLVFPVMFYVFFGLIFNRDGLDGQMPAYMLATYGVFGVIGPALFSFGVGVAIEKDQGWLALKQCSAMPIGAYFFAKIIASLLFGLIIILELFTLGALFGNVNMTSMEWGLTLISLLLGSLPFCALGLWLGLTVKGQAAPAIVNLIYLPMSIISGLWVPISIFPDWMQSFAWALPTFHLAQLTLAIQEFHLGYSVYIHAGVLLIMSIVFLLLATRAFKKQAIA
ncbi:ABC transporter permease [Glaciecola sp. 1036]|uniref:ABC transporter permease n=1 Tax=Alteromonadaceae TaxID=72275 RepID=UPI003D0906FC